MNEHELSCARALAGVTFLPGTPQKRFAREMLARARGNPADPLTPKQSLWLSALVWRYRRQIKNKPLVAACAIRTHAANYVASPCGAMVMGRVR